MENVDYKIKQALEKNIFFHLEECKNDFIPPLEQKINIKEYAKKIFDKAVTFEAWHNKKLSGLVAAYFNQKTSIAFITNVSVIKSMMGKGVASVLLKNCIEAAMQKKIKEIQLEVDKNNFAAVSFYKKFNFTNAGFNNDSIIMKLEIKNTQ